MKENWYALVLCMCKEISVDKALIKMEVEFKDGHKQMNPRASKYSDKFINNVLNLKNKGNSYREIGEILGITTDQAWGIARMYKEKATRTFELLDNNKCAVGR